MHKNEFFMRFRLVSWEPAIRLPAYSTPTLTEAQLLQIHLFEMLNFDLLEILALVKP